jgi:hypothetical protein
MSVSRRNRSYESPLRAEQMDRAREKLIEAVDIVAEAGGEELTVRLVAARAGVSVPTAYRHFPHRDAILDAMALWVNARVMGPGVPTTPEGVPVWARHIYTNFEIGRCGLRSARPPGVSSGRRIRRPGTRCSSR